MQQTALTADGRLDLKSRPWWDRAAALKLGESFVIDEVAESGLPRPGRMLVRRERFQVRSGQWIEGIVWVIDDDEDGSIRTGGDRDSDCYVADYGGDGAVDRMLDYIDDDGDGDADEMDIRYFTGGALDYAWFGMDLDDDSAMWSLTGYEYGGPSFFEADPYGNNLIYMNKLNPERGEWAPISECPFAFYDTDGDSFSEVVVRVSAVPLDDDPAVNPDYANNRFDAKWGEEMERMGVVNIRYSFDVDNLSGKDLPLHYDFGFNLVGSAAYDYRGMAHFNAKRRPPQVTRVIPHDQLRAIADRYDARETGFSWHEQHDDTIAIGYGDGKEMDFRWEGVFWIWERRFMGNSGGPGQRWNVRREWTGKPADRRELYYSEVDRRIHLFGAEEGWIPVGYFGGENELGEIRMVDTDGNGYFDRWEVYAPDSPVPLRVSSVRDERARRLPFDYEGLTRFYTEQVLPDAMAANNSLMAAMRRLRDFKAPPGLAAAMETGSPNVRRFAQDVVREMQYQDLRQHFTTGAHRILREAKRDDLAWLKAGELETTSNSHTAWRLIRALEELDVTYGQGDFDGACAALEKVAGVAAVVKP